MLDVCVLITYLKDPRQFEINEESGSLAALAS